MAALSISDPLVSVQLLRHDFDPRFIDPQAFMVENADRSLQTMHGQRSAD